MDGLSKTFGYDGSDNVEHHDFIQVLCPVTKYHFDDAYVCSTKDSTTTHLFNVRSNFILFNMKALMI